MADEVGIGVLDTKTLCYLRCDGKVTIKDAKLNALIKYDHSTITYLFILNKRY
ncbi:MAG: hypothetical protein QMD71_05840 [bacterium]|nr:hypothetical protein [bacterium]